MNQEAGFIELSINSDEHTKSEIVFSILFGTMIVFIIYYYIRPPSEIIT